MYERCYMKKEVFATDRARFARAPRLVLPDEQGNATVEFAFVGVLFFFLVAIAIQGALLYNAWLVITDVTTEAARYGSPCYGRSVQSCSLNDVQNYVWTNTAPTLDQSRLTVNASSSSGQITVTTTYAMPVVAPFVDAIVSNPTTISATSTMRLENGGT